MMERVVLSREELFERVWNTPVSKLAHEFGISDVALSKLCRRRGVPVPPRGYWAKLAVGQRLARPELPVVPPESQRPAILYRHLLPTREREVDSNGVPRLHPIADRVRKSLLLGKPGACGRVPVNQSGLPFVLASPRQATKVAELVDTLISEAERKGIDIVRNGADGDPLEFRRGKQAAHICIEEELRPRSAGAPDVLVPSGRLVLRLALDWRQTEDRPPEELLVSLISRLDHCLCSTER
jgi:hypothetical protein